MSQQAGTEQPTQGQNNSGTGDGQGQNSQTGNESQQQTQQQSQPALYAPYLERIPESVRGVVEPVFKEWDAGVTQRFQQLHSQFGWAQPWQEIAQQYDPDTVSQSLQVLQALSENPEGFYKALGESYGYGQQQVQQQQQQNQPNEFVEQGQQPQQQDDPRFAQLEQLVGSLAESIVSERQQQQEQQEEQELYAFLGQLKQEHGEFDEDYVLTKIAAGVDPIQAVQQYRQLVGNNNGQQNGPGQQAPVVMSGSGGVPSNTVDFRNLDRKGTQGLVASVLAANKSQG